MASGGATPGTATPAGTSTPLGLSKLNPANILSTNGSVPSGSPGIKICVFCGSKPGKSPAHMQAARDLARVFHENGFSLIYGGGTVGLMGEIARTLVSLSGPASVHGIIPQPLVKYERGSDPTNPGTQDELLPEYERYGKTTVVTDMHTRKSMMAKEVKDGAEGSGFIALPGGYGTLEELMEVVTWNQLGIHSRGIVVYNVEGYWDGLLDWVNNSVQAGFVGENTSGIIKSGRTAQECVDELRNYHNEEGRFKLEWPGVIGNDEDVAGI